MSPACHDQEVESRAIEEVLGQPESRAAPR
jgi:hypothetical protein